jgi:hypothetical protein
MTVWIAVPVALLLVGLLIWKFAPQIFGLPSPGGTTGTGGGTGTGKPTGTVGPKDNPITMQGGSFYIWSELQFNNPNSTTYLQVNYPGSVARSMSVCKDATCASAAKGPYPISGAFGVCSLDPHFVRVGSTNGTNILIESWKDLAHRTVIFSPNDMGLGSGWNAFGRAHVNQQRMSKLLYFRSGSNDCTQEPKQDCVPNKVSPDACLIGCAGQAGDSCYVRIVYN